MWDKVVGGSYQKILPIVGMLILTKCKQNILTMYKIDDIQAALLKVSHLLGIDMGE